MRGHTPGGSGVAGNNHAHAGKEYGVHIFFLQLRDEEHRMLPGIEAGDLGPKLGDIGIDTGYLRCAGHLVGVI